MIDPITAARLAACLLLLALCITACAAAPVQPAGFPVTTQFSPVPDGPGWHGEAGPLSEQALRETVDNIRSHGFTGLYCPLPLPEAQARYVMDYARSQGMYLTWITGGFELFGRDAPPAVCVYSPKYVEEVRKAVSAGLAPIKETPGVYNVFCYQDEPFHWGAKSFGYNDEVKAEFRKRYGYDLPPDITSIRDKPKVWQDVLDFRTGYFPDGWRKVYREIKAVAPDLRVIMTHDSHNTFGGGCGSHSELAIDDVFRWGGSFADTFVFDIYPYLMVDFRFGEPGKVMLPRMSQLHYALGQMRNLTRAYKKELGFWFGTYNDAWFKSFLGPEVEEKVWLERECSTTAVAHGCDFILTGYNIPQSARHWASLGDGLRLIQKAGSALTKTAKVRSRACFLFPRTQQIQLQEEYWNVGMSYELFERAFGEMDILHEDQVRDSRLGGYEMLVLCDVKLLPQAVAERIVRFVEHGGVVVADCVPDLDEFRRSSDVMPHLFGVKDAASNRIKRAGQPLTDRASLATGGKPYEPSIEERNPPTDRLTGRVMGQAVDLKLVSPRPCTLTDATALLTTASGRPGLVQRSVGKGQMYLLGSCLQDTYFQQWKDGDTRGREGLVLLLRAITDRCGVRPHVRSSNADIEAAVRANDREAYLFLIDHESPAPDTVVTLRDLPFTIARVTDLATTQDVPITRRAGAVTLRLSVPRGETRLLRLVPHISEGGSRG